MAKRPDGFDLWMVFVLTVTVVSFAWGFLIGRLG